MITGLLKLMKERQSARIPFDIKRSISQRELRQILEAGSWAPTAHNMQNFEALVVDDKKLIKKIRQFDYPVSPTFIQENYLQLSFSEHDLKKKGTGVMATMFPKSWQTPNLIPEHKPQHESEPLPESHNQLLACPVLIILLYNPAMRAPASENDFLGVMSLGCVLENMWLMASSLGISLHVVSALSDGEAGDKVKELLGIPPHLQIAISFRLGYPPASPAYLRVRRDLNSFTYHNHYGQKGFS
jgi:nitroreductase